MKLESVVPWGRSLSEYTSIFSLSDKDLTKKILGCGDGPASFNAELTQIGGKVTSADPTYCFTAEELQSRINEVYEEIIPKVQANKDSFIWESISSVEELGHIRMAAMQTFIPDFTKGKKEGRYLNASLPHLPFNDNEFELALCSHYLFLYSEQVSLSEHIKSLMELTRVAREVRIYPLVALNGELSPHLTPAIEKLNALGYKTERANVAYQFQKGATQMLVIKNQEKS